MKSTQSKRLRHAASRRTPLVANPAIAARLTGMARGSRVVLLASVICAPLVIGAGVTLAILAPQSTLLAALVIGSGVVTPLVALYLWTRSQPMTDRALGPPATTGSLTVKHGRNEITVVGDSEIMRSSSELQKQALDIISTNMSRKPLPRAKGKIVGGPADTRALIQFSPTEADEDSAAIGEIVKKASAIEKRAVEEIARLARHSNDESTSSSALMVSVVEGSDDDER